MGDIETLGIFDEIQSLVSDNLQVVCIFISSIRFVNCLGFQLIQLLVLFIYSI